MQPCSAERRRARSSLAEPELARASQTDRRHYCRRCRRRCAPMWTRGVRQYCLSSREPVNCCGVVCALSCPVLRGRCASVLRELWKRCGGARCAARRRRARGARLAVAAGGGRCAVGRCAGERCGCGELPESCWRAAGELLESCEEVRRRGGSECCCGALRRLGGQVRRACGACCGACGCKSVPRLRERCCRGGAAQSTPRAAAAVAPRAIVWSRVRGRAVERGSV
jgi:hypothetical protein